MDLVNILNSHEKLAARMRRSSQELTRVRKQFEHLAESDEEKAVAIFCAGSLAREEIGSKSDLDLFFIGGPNDISAPTELFKYRFFGKVIRFNEELGYSEFSNDGRFLKIQPQNELIAKTGTPIDDSENLFTTRMLLILESKWIVGQDRYHECLSSVVGNYFRDSRGKQNFKPLFVVNDLLRYWRTLCLNYEQRRNDPDQPWRKKNVNLRFSRMVTVFSTVLALIADSNRSIEDVLRLCQIKPLERMAIALEMLGDKTVEGKFSELLDRYEEFLSWKERDDIEEFLEMPEKNTICAIQPLLYRSLFLMHLCQIRCQASTSDSL